TGASGGGASQASYARFATAYHCFGASGSVGTKETRRTRSGWAHATPAPAPASVARASTDSARNGARLVGRAPVARSIAADTTLRSAPGRSPTVVWPATLGAGRASAAPTASAQSRARRLTR